MKGRKIVLSREESTLKIEDAVNVVEGANLIHNEYGNRLLLIFSFLSLDFMDFTYSQVW